MLSTYKRLNVYVPASLIVSLNPNILFSQCHNFLLLSNSVFMNSKRVHVHISKLKALIHEFHLNAKI